ncbi:MAG: sodium-extruding oxaloacetate decarboxylase subunit alpha [Magnetococcales bacterium]|nr:sodium-extruding oxaloacetate decarboxylase subunit alpha [Magnetococcales bacterium]
MTVKKPLGITELVLRDAHQSLLATRMRIDDMLPIAAQLDQVGYWSLETWGGATFDACIRFLGEDPWERLRRLKAAMPRTPMQMLFRGQNILGYRHYADDVVEKFVERAALHGIDVFRIFDAMNDVRNLQTAIKATLKVGKHAQGTLSYTLSPVHSLEYWLDMGKRLEEMGCHSVCIKDMAGLLKPSVAFELVSRLKESLTLPIALHCHATTGLSTATILKAVEAGLDLADTSVSSMSMTTCHSATESVVAMLQEQERDTGLDLQRLEGIAGYFRDIRKKYHTFEGELRGVDARILLAQVPGGMLSNMESQLKAQGVMHKMDAVLAEIPSVRQDLGYLPLVTPTSQIVGTQAVLNVVLGERYKTIAKETQAILRGEYGATPAPVSAALQARVLKEGESPITCRPADLLPPELERLTAELQKSAAEGSIRLAEPLIDDVLTYALFAQVGLKFLANRGNPGAFEPLPTLPQSAPAASPKAAPPPPSAPAPSPTAPGQAVVEHYRVVVNGRTYQVEVGPAGIQVVAAAPAPADVAAPAPAGKEPTLQEVPAPLTGTITKILLKPHDTVPLEGVVMLMEAMKMETEIRAPQAGTLVAIPVQVGDSVQTGDTLFVLS